MKRLYTFSIIVACIIPISGCGVAVIAAVETVRGDQSGIVLIEPVQNLRPYHTIVFEPVSSSVADHIDPSLLNYMNKRIHDELVQSGIQLSDEGQLLLSGEVLHIADTLREKQLVVKMTLRATDTGRSLGIANITSQSRGLRGLKSSAGGIAKEVSELLKTHLYLVET